MLLKNQIKYFGDHGFECTVVTSDGDAIEKFKEDENCKVKIINMNREVTLFKDLVSLIKMIVFLANERPTIVNSGTPKSGLIMMIASFITRVPIRIYTLHGLRLETITGFKKNVLMTTEKIAMYCSTKTLAVSPSLRTKAIDLKLINATKIAVIGKGSNNGVDLERFRDTKNTNESLLTIRRENNIDEKDFILGFVGRLTKDKGIEELVLVFQNILDRGYDVKLLIVGLFEANDVISDRTKNIIINHPKIVYVGYQDNPVPYFHLMDLFLLLTKREGFGNVAIEAASIGLPVIVNDVTGAKDTLVNNKTGYILDAQSLPEVADKIIYLYTHEKFRKKLGENGSQWVNEHFSQESIHKKLNAFYLDQLSTLPGSTAT